MFRRLAPGCSLFSVPKASSVCRACAKRHRQAAMLSKYKDNTLLAAIFNYAVFDSRSDLCTIPTFKGVDETSSYMVGAKCLRVLISR